MTLHFLDRKEEMGRLTRTLGSEDAALVILFGRRRCGKSRLIQELTSSRPGDIYYLADLRDAQLQRESLAEAVAQSVPGFDTAQYRDWHGLFQSLRHRATRGICVHVDEFPNLVKVSPELPSVLQKLIDTEPHRTFHLSLCGSSGRMMHGLTMDASAPLYGRAAAIVKVRPLPPGWIVDALGVDPVAAVEAYAVWGGVPRYWELCRGAGGVREAVREQVLRSDGVLHDEPARLLLDEMRTSVQAHSVLSLVGSGCNRISEIAARLGKPAASLMGVVGQLCDLGYVRRDVPFGESEKSSRRSRYRLADPFLRFWYRFVLPNESLLEMGRIAPVLERIESQVAQHTAAVWEDLARWSLPFLRLDGREWDAASRWWGPGGEVDLVAESLDRKAVLVGEAKWSDAPDWSRILYELERKASALHLPQGRELRFAVWSKVRAPAGFQIAVVTPDQVMTALR